MTETPCGGGGVHCIPVSAHALKSAGTSVLYLKCNPMHTNVLTEAVCIHHLHVRSASSGRISPLTQL